MPVLHYIEFNKDTPIEVGLGTRYLVAVLGAWAAEAGTYPLDLVKTRLQIQSEIAASGKDRLKVERHGLFGVLIAVVRKEGVLALWSGLLPMLQRNAIYSGSRLVIYEKLRDLVPKNKEENQISLAMTCLVGATAGATAQFLASPCDLVKVKMQAEGRRLQLGKPPLFKSCTEAYMKTYAEGGVLGLWRGSLLNSQRAALVNVGDLASYDYFKRYYMKQLGLSDNIYLHTISAFSAGFLTAILGTPADILKTRMMNQPVGPDGKGKLYRGVIDCAQKSVKNEGLLSLYKGFMPFWMRLGPWSLINWVTFDSIMRYLGADTF